MIHIYVNIFEDKVDFHIMEYGKREIYKIKENYRWQIIVKGEFSSKFSKSIKDILYDKANNVYNDIRVSMDINPNSLS